MSHPVLGLPPADARAGDPIAAAHLRASRARLANTALEATQRLDPTFATRYDEVQRRTFLRDYDRHIEQLARALKELAGQVDRAKLKKHPRGPKKPRPPRRRSRRVTHVATARIVAKRRAASK